MYQQHRCLPHLKRVATVLYFEICKSPNPTNLDYLRCRLMSGAKCLQVGVHAFEADIVGT